MSKLEAIKYRDGKLEILDQTLLPSTSKYIPIESVQDGWKVINKMQVRGAPAIAITGCLSLAVDLNHHQHSDKKSLKDDIESKMNYLVSARPTAVNIKLAANDISRFVDELYKDANVSTEQMLHKLLEFINNMLVKDLNDNKSIGEFGADEILKEIPDNEQVRILTHCNTGSLATTGYGTALGVIRSLHSRKRLEKVFCTETRPYNQGARLTAYELVYERIPATLICDDMVAALMMTKSMSAVVVGADRVAANGDTANKIGTYQIAIVAKYHRVPFYIAAPQTSIDFNLTTGKDIPIEYRPESEMTHLNNQRIAAEGIQCWNPAFDVTPASLITGIITDVGVFKPDDLINLKAKE